MGVPAQGPGAARACAQRLPVRRLRRARDLPRRHHPRAAGADERRVRGHGAGARAAGRRARPHRRHRPGEGRRKGFLCPRGQCAHAVGRLLCAGEPRGHDAAGARAVLGHARPAGRRLFRGASGHPTLGIVQRRRRAQRRAADAGPFQLGLLRACLPGRRDGHRAGRGLRPVRRRRPRLHAHAARPAEGRRDLPPGRRQLPRSAGDAAGFLSRRRRVAGRAACRPGQYRERAGQRRGRRQVDLYLCARDGALLSRRGAHPGQCADLALRSDRRFQVCGRTSFRTGGQGNPRLGRQGHAGRPDLEQGRDRGVHGAAEEPAGQLHRPADPGAVDLPNLRQPGRGAAPCRSPALRAVGAQDHHHSRRPHARGAEGRLAGREFEPGRRHQGHLGAGAGSEGGGSEMAVLRSHCWERATPVAQSSVRPANEAPLEWRAPSKDMAC